MRGSDRDLGTGTGGPGHDHRPQVGVQLEPASGLELEGPLLPDRGRQRGESRAQGQNRENRDDVSV